MKARHIMKKAAAVVLAGVMLISASAFGSFAAEKTPRGYITANTTFYNQYRDVIETIAEGLYRHDETIDVSSYRISWDDAIANNCEMCRNLYTSAFESNPDLFYLDQGAQFGLSADWVDGGFVLGGIVPEYTLTVDEMNRYKDEYYKKLDYYLGLVDDSMSDLDKALVLHDALAVTKNYDTQKGVFDFVFNDTGRCFGYNQTYAYLLAQVGIKSEIVSGYGGSSASTAAKHQWMKAYIDGKYYNIDLTFDDPKLIVGGVSMDMMGYVKHTNFLVSDSTSNATHFSYTSAYPVTDKSKESLLIHNLTNPVVAVKGKLYTVVNDSNGFKNALVSYDSAANKYTLISELGNTWYEKGTNNTSWYTSHHTGVAAYGDYVYFNAPKAIYSYRPSTGEISLFANNNYDRDFYAIEIKGNQIYATIADSVSSNLERVYIGECYEPEPEPEPVDPILGDANGDGEITICDVTAIQRAAAGLITLRGPQKTLSDVNGDGEITIQDATELQRYIAGMEEYLLKEMVQQ